MSAPRKTAGYGWIPQMPDHRDRYFGLEEPILTPMQVPSTGGLAPDELPPIWNQGQLGACTAHGSLRAFLAEAMRQGLSLPMLSRLQQYYDTRSIEGTTSTDSGGTIRDAIKALATYGCAPESEWPYDVSRFADPPPASVMSDARQHMAISYQQIVVGGPGAPMRTALSRKLVIVKGFPVPDYFEDGSWDPASGEPLPLPGPNTQFIGGHCTATTFYDFSGTFISTPSTNRRVRPYFTDDNSWDTTWGMAGRFNIDAEWFSPGRGLASDLWVIQQDE